MKRSQQGVPLPKVTSTLRLIAGLPLRAISEAAGGYSQGHVLRVLRGERTCSPRLLAALVRLGLVERAEATAHAVLDVLDPKRRA
jgi:hypothetical protein